MLFLGMEDPEGRVKDLENQREDREERGRGVENSLQHGGES